MMMGDSGVETGFNVKGLQPIQKESAKLAVDVSHGIMVEALKNFMFAKWCTHKITQYVIFYYLI